MERKRLVPDRFRRIWGIVEEIAANPGHSRGELAAIFHLSERQIQSDINIVRSDMRLPLIRRQGYRFVSEGVTGPAMTMDLREAQLLVMILQQAMKDRSIPKDRLGSLMCKLPPMFPPHLQPLVARTLEAVTGAQSQQRLVFAALGDGLLRGQHVKLHYPLGGQSVAGWLGDEPELKPELLLPYLSGWFVIGEPKLRPNSSVMLDLGAVQAVTLAEMPAAAGVRR